MKDLYSRLGLTQSDVPAHEIQAALDRSDISASDRRDASVVLLNANRKRNYDRAWATLKTVGALRANLGLSHGDYWTETDFDRTPESVSELDALREFLQHTANARTKEASGVGRAFWSILLVGGALWILFQALNSNSPDKSLDTTSLRQLPAIEFSEPAQPTPITGTANYYLGGLVAPFEVITSPGANYFVKLVEPTSGTTVVDVFIRGGERMQIDVPLGTFEMRYAAGQTWYGAEHLFGPATNYNKSDRLFSFTSDYQGVSGYTVELILQTDGNLRTRSIDASEF